MSVKAKGINIEKIIATFKKSDFDDQLNAFGKIADHLGKEAEERLSKAESDVKKLKTIKERVNGKE